MRETPAPRCNGGASYLVRVINQAFLLSTVNVELQGQPNGDASAAFGESRLNSAAVQYFPLHLSLKNPIPFEYVFEFNAGRRTQDLGGRAQLSLLLHCR